ncbi:hypothetical protein GA0070616_1839 [Micromonospora nigra]|uniref:Uncharacterized protein n=1 Tax=Micromonospora nigra TaxID=145857 RepID=A0A1C6RRR5_9ACTN|nr:hypothetical protein [Micromonospora nigra]SCL19856.1 hypothetical protein GA0070616_1839 [Micromonospora nigra]
MAYRYESDEDAYVKHSEDGPELSPPEGPPPPAGPSPSRFPTPSLPHPNQLVLAATAPPRVAAPPPPPADEEEPPVSLLSDEPPRPTGEPTPRRGPGRAWQVLVGTAAVLVLLGLGGLIGAVLLTDRDTTPQAAPSADLATTRDHTPTTSDLDSRDTDQAPLTAREVFPGDTLVVADGRPAYRVLRTNSSGSCAVATTGEVSDLLVRLGCNQVVRATLRTSDGEHLVTAGLFNLTDRSSAERARDRVRQILDERQGRFRGMPADEQTDTMATAPARVGWQVRGHYLAYAVVTRSDVSTIRSGDTTVREVLFDLIELHLNRGVLERRADGGTAAQPNQGTDDDTGGQDGTGSSGD